MSPKKTKKRDEKRNYNELNKADNYTHKQDFEDEEILQMNGP